MSSLGGPTLKKNPHQADLGYQTPATQLSVGIGKPQLYETKVLNMDLQSLHWQNKIIPILTQVCPIE